MGEEVANKMKQLVDPVKWFNSSEQQLQAAEAEFFLYKEYGALIASLDRLRFCVACTTFDHELQERMERDVGRNDLYELVENQMSMESLIDGQQIAVDIRGQLKPDLKNIRLK